MSSAISWTTAQSMIRAYEQNDNKLLTPTSNGVKTLKGLRISKTNIEAIFNQSNVAELFIMFAVREEDLGQPTQYFTTIVAGINTSNNILTNQVFDYCDPCPDSCPANMV